MTQMQQLFYDQAPYQMLYYDDELHVYRTTKFSNWQNQPVDGGTPFFVNGSINYTKLKLASAASPSPSASASASAGPAASGSSAPVAATPVPSAGGSAAGGQQRLDAPHPRDRPGPARDRGGRRPGPPAPGSRGRRRVAAVVRAR